MSRPALLVYSAGMLLAAVASFLFGFVQLGSAQNAAQSGILVGIISATAWGIGSMGGPPTLSNWANIFAAMFASMSLGFLAPADEACKNAPGLFGQACELRAKLH